MKHHTKRLAKALEDVAKQVAKQAQQTKKTQRQQR